MKAYVVKKEKLVAQRKRRAKANRRRSAVGRIGMVNDQHPPIDLTLGDDIPGWYDPDELDQPTIAAAPVEKATKLERAVDTSPKASTVVNRRRSKADVSYAKEVQRLRALVAKLTVSKPGKEPKPRYLDDKAMAVRWTMSVKQFRALRYAG